MADGDEASNTVISGDAATEILHSRSVITPDQVKLFRELDEDYLNFYKKAYSMKADIPTSLQDLSSLKPATQDSSPNGKCKNSHAGSSKTEQVAYPMYKSLACKLGLSDDVMKKYTEFSLTVPALNFYNQENGTNFKLVDTTHSRMFYFGGMWGHCVFQVALPDSPCTHNFFAEVLRNDEIYEEKFETKTVRALYGTPCYKCCACDDLNIPHPQEFVSQAFPSP